MLRAQRVLYSSSNPQQGAVNGTQAVGGARAWAKEGWNPGNSGGKGRVAGRAREQAVGCLVAHLLQELLASAAQLVTHVVPLLSGVGGGRGVPSSSWPTSAPGRTRAREV